MSDAFRIVPAGDAALIVEFEERIDPAINRRAVFVADSIQAAGIAGIRDVVPTYRSVAVHFDPLRTDVSRLTDRLELEGARPVPRVDVERSLVRIPVCYGGAFGPDLDDVAALAGMSSSEVTGLHSGAIYRVFMLGFLPGFAYMASVDLRIAAPRRETPRVKVPAGSVGIAGEQTGIYPCESPGGWQLIGCTPARPYDPARPEPFLLKAGDRVQFYPVAAADYERSARM